MAGNFLPLERIVSVKGGKRLPAGESLQVNRSSHPYIRIRDMGNRLLPSVGLEYVPDSVFPSIQRYIVNENDVIISIVGTIGLVSLIDARFEKASLTENAAKLTGLDNVDATYLYYCLRSENGQKEIYKGTVGAVQPKLPLYNILKLPVPWFERKVRERIAHVLGTLDDLIELNRETNEILEEMARALFKSWFVDFDPVRAKLEGRPPAGMDAETAKLFPDHFQDSEIGQIPKGWEVKSLASLSSYLSRGIGPSYVEEGGICVLNQKCVRDHRVDLTKARRHCAAKKKVDGRLLESFDVLVNSTGTGTLGRVAQIFHLDEDTIVDSHVTVVRAASDVDPCFLGGAITSRETDIAELAEGSTGQTELSRTRLGELTIVTPDSEIQRAFGRQIGPTLHLISANDLESRDLATLRDTLLPKLLSGEVSVPVAEELIAASR